MIRSRPPSRLAGLAALIAAVSWSGASPPTLAAQAFGSAVVVIGDRLLVGSPSSERLPGQVHAYARSGDDWVETEVLEASSIRTGFGAALAAAGSHAFVGEPSADAGRVHVFERLADGTWGPIGVLTAGEVASLGRALAADGDRLLASAADPADERGVALVFERGEAGYAVVDRLAPPEDRDAEAFGASLALAGDLAVVGAPGEEDRAGAAYVFRAGPEGWRPAGRLVAPEGRGASGRGFGVAVAVVADRIWVGMPGADRALGAVERFAADGEGWAHVGTLAPEVEPPAAFGAAIAPVSGGVLVGAPALGRGVGGLFAVSRTDAGWTVGDAVRVEAEDRLQAGGVLAADGSLAALGLPADDFGAGSVRMAMAARGWSPAARLASEQVGLPAISGGQVDCEAGTAERFDCDAVDLLSFVPREHLGAGRGSRLNDVWGWTDPETGREYAIVGLMDGTAFVDVSDPSRPRYLGNLPKHEGSRANTWRDMKVYADHAFIVADGAGDHGMQIFDLRQLADVTDPVIFEETAHYDRIASAHNIVINEGTGFGYIVGSGGGGETCGGGLHMVDLSEPTSPAFAGCFAHANTGRTGTGYSHDAQCVAYTGPDADYAGREICFSANETALSIADVTEKAEPIAISSAAYPNVGYAHQGWLSEDHRYFYSNDELDEVGGLVDGTRTLVWDVRDLDDPTLVTEYYSPTNVTDHNMYVRGDRLYMSNNRAGLRVVDISDPASPVEIGFFDTTPWSEDEPGFDGTWSVYPYFESGVILLSSRREGLFLVKPREQRLVP